MTIVAVKRMPKHRTGVCNLPQIQQLLQHVQISNTQPNSNETAKIADAGPDEEQTVCPPKGEGRSAAGLGDKPTNPTGTETLQVRRDQPQPARVEGARTAPSRDAAFAHPLWFRRFLPHFPRASVGAFSGVKNSSILASIPVISDRRPPCGYRKVDKDWQGNRSETRQRRPTVPNDTMSRARGWRLLSGCREMGASQDGLRTTA